MSDESSVPLDAIAPLADLASVILRREVPDNLRPAIVPIVGAGASASADLPTGFVLKTKIENELMGRVQNVTPLYSFLDAEASKHFNLTLSRLSLFEFASLVWSFDYARDKIVSVLERTLKSAKSRPIAYELLAHLLKHNFIDHIISVNFDTLLGDALYDEIPNERMHVIDGPDDVPGSRSLLNNLSDNDKAYLLKPFGSLTRDRYHLRLEDVLQYGSDSVWEFCVRRLTRRPHAGIILLLIGYAAEEPAFQKLIEELKSKQRFFQIFVIDTKDKLSGILSGARHIKMQADVALTLLLDIMREMQEHKIWIPVARHHVVANILTNEQCRTPEIRFKIEVILQAVKSRGFFTLEALGEVERIRRYDREARSAIDQLCQNGTLKAQPWSGGEPTLQDYRLLLDNEKLASNIVQW
jgi:hypothetical protein